MLEGYSNAISSFGLAIEKRRVHFEGGNLEEVSSLCYKKASDNQSATGKHYLGICYEQGFGMEKDLDKAAYYFKRALDLGYLNAK